MGAASGLLSLWDEKFFTVEKKVVSNRYILLVGMIKSKNFRCGFGNIYTPNDDRERQAFWEDLGIVIKNLQIP